MNRKIIPDGTRGTSPYAAFNDTQYKQKGVDVARSMPCADFRAMLIFSPCRRACLYRRY